jgi:hypothetical protein
METPFAEIRKGPPKADTESDIHSTKSPGTSAGVLPERCC